MSSGCKTKFFFAQGRPAGTPGRLGEASLTCNSVGKPYSFQESEFVNTLSSSKPANYTQAYLPTPRFVRDFRRNSLHFHLFQAGLETASEDQ